MSVLQIPGHVMITQIVPILTALTAVPVNWVSLVMERLVKVHKISTNNIHALHPWRIKATREWIVCFWIIWQISMSALAIPVHVIKMLDASILKVLSAVLVNRDTLEVAKYVKVRRLSVHSHPQDSNFGGKNKVARKWFIFANLPRRKKLGLFELFINLP